MDGIGYGKRARQENKEDKTEKNRTDVAKAKCKGAGLGDQAGMPVLLGALRRTSRATTGVPPQGILVNQSSVPVLPS